MTELDENQILQAGIESKDNPVDIESAETETKSACQEPASKLPSMRIAKL